MGRYTYQQAARVAAGDRLENEAIAGGAHLVGLGLGLGSGSGSASLILT